MDKQYLICFTLTFLMVVFTCALTLLVLEWTEPRFLTVTIPGLLLVALGFAFIVTEKK